MNGPSIRETEWTYFSASHTLDTIVKLSNRLPLFADILISLTMATQAAWWSRFFLSRHGLSVSHGLSRWSRTVWKTSHPFITIYIYIYTSSVFILDEFRPERSWAKLIKRQLIDSRERCGARLWLKIVNSNDRSAPVRQGAWYFIGNRATIDCASAPLEKSPVGMQPARTGRENAKIENRGWTRLTRGYSSFFHSLHLYMYNWWMDISINGEFFVSP